MYFSCGSVAKCLINTQAYIRVDIFKCSNISNIYVDFGDNTSTTFTETKSLEYKSILKTYTKLSLFTITWTMIGFASGQSQINCIKLRIIYIF